MVATSTLDNLGLLMEVVRWIEIHIIHTYLLYDRETASFKYDFMFF